MLFRSQIGAAARTAAAAAEDVAEDVAEGLGKAAEAAKFGLGSALPALTGLPGSRSLLFRLPEAPGSDVTFVVEAQATLDSGAWQEIARRVTDGAWTGPASVSEGPPSGGRVPVSLSEINPPPDAKRFYRLGAIVAPSAP